MLNKVPPGHMVLGVVGAVGVRGSEVKSCSCVALVSD